MTNSIKYAEAKDIFISVTVKEKGIDILFLDNGKGCDTLVLGNGLNGIKERLRLVGGNAEFITGNNEGFMSKIRI